MSEIPVFVFVSCSVMNIQNKKNYIIQESPGIYLVWLASVARMIVQGYVQKLSLSQIPH